MLKNKTIIFVHVRKTGGITLRLLLKGKLSGEEYFKLKPPINKLSDLNNKKLEKLKFISGHVSYGLHKKIPKDSEYITILRDPVDRIISLYKHLKRAGSNITIKELTVKEKNNQILMFGKNLEDAKNILSSFMTVGTTEKFDRTVVVLRNKIGAKKMYYAKKANVGENKVIISDEDKEYIRDLNKEEYELHKYANELLEKEIKKYGIKFYLDLLIYKIMNKIYGIYHRF